MIAPEIREAILALKAKGTPVRKIARLLKLSRNSVRQALRQPPPPTGVAEPAIPTHLLTPLTETFVRCEGNVVRVQEVLEAEHAITIPYSTLTRWVREADLRAPKQRCGSYRFEMGEEMQFDTSPHHLKLGDKCIKAQCASLVLAYSRRLFVRYFPCFAYMDVGKGREQDAEASPASRPRPFCARRCALWMGAPHAAWSITPMWWWPRAAERRR
jgi:transposase